MLETTAPTVAPERADYLRRAATAIATRILAQMLDELAAPSTDSPSLGDRAMLAVLRPWIPKLRDTLLSRLSEVDPVSLERNAGAIALAIESLLAQAPGDPLPRYRMDWDADGRVVLVPLEAGADG